MKTKLNLLVVGIFLAAMSTALAQPVITTQPTNHFVNASAAVTFSVGVSGTGPFTYEWLFDGTAIAGANNSSLPLSNLQPASSGYYSVIITNVSGSVTSQVAELKVFLAARHKVSSIQVEPDRSVSLSFAGETTASFAPYYDLYPLETSSNLVVWAPLATLQRSNTALDTLGFLDTNAPAFSQRFYRTPTNQLATPDPQPTGPYAVGTFSMELTNSRRSNAKFMVTFWYPAAAQAGVLPAKYVEPQVAAGEWGYNFTSRGGGNFISQVTAFFSHSLSNAPLATNLSVYPVVLYDSAATGHRRENTDKTEDLASWGYVVVGLDTSDTQVSVFPDGTVVYAQTTSLSTMAQLDADIEGRLLDLQFVLDELESLNASDPRLGGRLDLDKIGVFGWSLGGATAAQLCLRDPRCKAGAGMDGSFYEANVLTQPLSVPYLFFRGGDGPDPSSGGGTLLDGRPDDRWEFYNEQVTNAYWVKLVSTVHLSFGDVDLILDSGSIAAGWGVPMSGQFLPPARVSQIVRTYLLSFFNKFLRGEDDHSLDGPSPAYPEVMQFLSTSSFSVPPEYPQAALALGSDGNFYGTTEYGGASGEGTVFQMTPAGALTTLVSFNGTNGSYPYAGLVQGSDGNFYGTTCYGGAGNLGTVFQMTPAGMLTMLVSFSGTNGSYPYAGLVQGSGGNFYGTTLGGGASGIGSVFKMTPAGALTTLVSFNNNDGAAPLAALVQGINGNFYGTTSQGGNLSVNSGAGYGTVFEMTPAGVLTTLVVFNGSNGGSPTAALVQGTNGNFYGTTEYGGASGKGTVFKMTPAGVLSTLISFNLANGWKLSAGLVQGSDGNFYGTTDGGGAGGGGTVFKTTPAGALTTLVSFNGANGNSPQAPLVQGSDGNFYGTTEYGGVGGLGTVFEVTPAGVFATLVSLACPEALLITPATGFASIGGVGGPFTITSQSLSLTNAGTNSLTWTLANTSLWLNASPGSGTLTPGGPAATVTVSLNSTASNLVVGTYSATVWFTNLNDNVGRTCQFSLSVMSPPTITTQPANQTVPTGGAALFSVVATSSLPLSYFWQRNSMFIAGATNSSYTTNNVQLTDSGSQFSCLVSNAYGTTNSQAATLTVLALPPSITQQPANQTVPPGSAALFSVVATGSLPLSYSWQRNGTAIASATNSSYTTNNVQLSDSGSQFSCLVSNAYGSVLSSNALLTVVLVQNGGFELGTFADWTISGTFDNCSVNSDYVHSGVYGAELGPEGSLSYISQTIPTTVGQTYLVSCWLYCDGQTPNEFSLSWNGATLFDQQNIGATLWTNLQFQASATATNTVLTLGFQDDPSYLGLDDIAVYPITP